MTWGATNWDMLLYRKSRVWGCYKSRHVTKRDKFLFINLKILDFKSRLVTWFPFLPHKLFWIPFWIPLWIPLSDPPFASHFWFSLTSKSVYSHLIYTLEILAYLGAHMFALRVWLVVSVRCGNLKMVGPKKRGFCKEVTRFQGFHLIFWNEGAWGLRS